MIAVLKHSMNAERSHIADMEDFTDQSTRRKIRSGCYLSSGNLIFYDIGDSLPARYCILSTICILLSLFKVYSTAVNVSIPEMEKIEKNMIFII